MQDIGEIRRMILGPDGWEDDEIAGFISVTEDSTRSIFETYRDDWRSIGMLRSLFEESVIAMGKQPSGLSGQLLMMANTYFMAAFRLVAAGQGITASPLLRSMLECSLYAWHADSSDTKQRETAWLNRQMGPDERKKTTAEFGSPSKIIKELSKTHAQVSEDVKASYERLIDFGAHPNIGGFVAHCVLMVTEEGFAMRHDSFISDPFWIQQTFEELRNATIITIRVFGIVFPEAFSTCNYEARLEAVNDLASRIGRALPTLPIEKYGPRQEDLTTLHDLISEAFKN